MSGCLVKTNIVRQGLVPIPEDAKGWLYVAQERPILVGIEGSDIVVKKDVSGYYLLHRIDLQAIMKRLKAAR